MSAEGAKGVDGVRSHSLTHRCTLQSVSLVSLAIVVLVVQFVLIEIPWPSDPMFGYFDGATVFSGAGTEIGLPRTDLRLHHRYLRLGLLAPIALLQWVFGYSEIAYYGVGFASIASVAVLTAVFARRLLPWPLGIAAGALAVLNPLVLHWSSHPQPDLLMTAWLLAGLVALPTGDAEHSARPWRFAAAGIAFVVAWSVKETAPLLFGPVAVVAIWASRARLREWAALAVGATAAVGVEAAVLWQATGSPLSRVDVLLDRQFTGDGTMSAAMRERHELLVRQQGTYLGAAASWGRNLLRASPPLAALLLAPAGALLGVVRHRDRWWGVLAVWTLWPWAFYTMLGPTRAANGVVTTPLSNDWYWHVLLPPTAIGFVALVWFAARRTWTSRVAVVAGCATALVLVAAVWPATSGDVRMVRNDRGEYEELRDWLSSRERPVTATSPLQSLRVLGLYDTPPWGGPSTAEFVRLRAADADTLLIIDPWTRSDSLPLGSQTVSTVAPPDDFDVAFVSSNGLLLALAPSTRPTAWTTVSHADGAADAGTVVPGGEVLRVDGGRDLGPGLRLRLRGRLGAGTVEVHCPDGGQAAYGGHPRRMARFEEWHFFCPPGDAAGGDVVIAPMGGTLFVDEIALGRR